MKKALLAALVLGVAHSPAIAQEQRSNQNWRTLIADDGEPYEIGYASYYETNGKWVKFLLREVKNDVPEFSKEYGKSFNYFELEIGCTEKSIFVNAMYWEDYNSQKNDYRLNPQNGNKYSIDSRKDFVTLYNILCL